MHYVLQLMTAKMMITWMQKNKYLHQWLQNFNGIQDGTTYSGIPVYNIPKFMTLYNIINSDILHCLCFHCVLRHFVLKGKGNDDEEKWDLVMSHWRKLRVELSASGNWKRDRLLQNELSKMSIERWKRFKSSTARMARALKDWQIRMGTGI